MKVPGSEHNRPWLALILAAQAGLVFWLSLRYQGLWISDDEFPYLGQAVGLWLGHFPLDPTRPLLYPLFLSIWLRLFGYNLFWLRFVQGICLVLTTALVYRFALRAAGPRPALIAAALFAFFPDGLFFAHRFYRESLAAFLLMLGLNLMLAFEKSKRPVFAPLAAGFVFGLLVLLKPECSSLLALLALLLLGLGFQDRGQRAAKLQFAGLLLLASAITILQMVSIDRVIYNEWIFVTTYKGYNYSLSYCGELADPKAGRPPFSFLERDGARYQAMNPFASRLLYHPTSSVSYGERDDMLAKKALGCIRAEPGKVLYFYGARWLEGIYRLDLQAAQWVLKGFYGTWPQPLIWMILLLSLAINLAVLAGLALAPLNAKPNLPSALALLVVLWHLFYYASVFYLSRFRIATFPCFIILAAIGLAGVASLFQSPARWKKILALVVAALLLLPGFSNFINADNLRLLRPEPGPKRFALGPGTSAEVQSNYFILFGNRFRDYGRLDLFSDQFGKHLKKISGSIKPSALMTAARYYVAQNDPAMARFYASLALNYPETKDQAAELLKHLDVRARFPSFVVPRSRGTK